MSHLTYVASMTHLAQSAPTVHPSHLTYAEAGVVGLLQGITELFPVSSLGHAVLIPALIGGQWAQDLDVSKAESPYLAFIVGLHVATATAMIIFFWRDWVRIVGAFFGSIRHVIAPEPATRRFELQGTDQKLAWISSWRRSRSASPGCCSSTRSAQSSAGRSSPPRSCS
jgi:hypothetical protein